MRASRKVLRRILYAAVVVLVFGTGFVWLEQIHSPHPDVTRPPNEKNRVLHPAGFSIVKPGRTKARVDPDALIIMPDGGRSRYTPSLMVRRWVEPPDLTTLREYAPGTFQGGEALIFNGPSGKYVTWAAVVRRGDNWFSVSLSLPEGSPGSEAMPPPGWLAYLNTFRVEGGIAVLEGRGKAGG